METGFVRDTSKGGEAPKLGQIRSAVLNHQTPCVKYLTPPVQLRSDLSPEYNSAENIHQVPVQTMQIATDTG
jgi:hypothetical protein